MRRGGLEALGSVVLGLVLIVGPSTFAPEAAEAEATDDSTVTVVESLNSPGELVIARIRYLSRSSVYIDRGLSDGLTEQTELSVYRDGRQIADLEIVYLANHSASCRVRTAEDALAPGDEVHYRVMEPLADSTRDRSLLESRGRSEVRPRERRRHVDASRLRGSAALEWDAFVDGENADRDYQRPSLYLRMDAERIRGRPVDVRVHVRTDYLQRSRSLGSDRPAEEWVHRIYRLSLTWADRSRPFRLSIGRLLANGPRGVGNWDGGLLEVRVGDSWQFGVLGGGESALDGEYDLGRQKYGAYVTLDKGSMLAGRYRGSVGFVGQYDDGTVSREFAVWTNEVAFSRRVRLRQDMELDVNRGWRKDVAGGKPTTLSRLNLQLDGQVSTSVRVRVGYDLFENVRRLDTRDIPDSLFFDPRQQGLRVGASWRASDDWGLRGQVGLRGQEDEDRRPVFANATAFWHDFLGSRTSMQLRYAYADGRYARSHSPAVEIRRNFGSRLHLGAGFGAQVWDGFRRDSLAVNGEWIRFFGTWTLARQVDLQWMATRSVGDIGPGTRGHLRLTRRL